MIDLKGFRKSNNLTQDELGEFLGVKKSFISKIENGGAALPEDKFAKLLANNRGWDTSLLTENIVMGDSIHQNGGRNNIGKIAGDAGELLALRKENEMLRAQIEELKAQNEKYWEAIKDLMKK